MTDRIHDTRRGPRVGFFGLLGSGNLGNDGSLDAFLAYLHKEYPDAEVDFLCAGPDQIVDVVVEKKMTGLTRVVLARHTRCPGRKLVNLVQK